MREYLALGFAVVLLALTMIVWAKSGGMPSTNSRSSASMSPHEMMSNSKDLPV
jgi:hypothetical protein